MLTKKKKLLIFMLLMLLILVYKQREKYSNIEKIKTYCISLLTRPDRKEKFINNIKNKLYYPHLDIEIVNAVYGLNLDPKVFMDNDTLTKGEIGCYLSHIQCLLRFLSTDVNDQYCIVCEDDADCKDNLNVILSKNYYKLFDIIILGTNYVHEGFKCIENIDEKIDICNDFKFVYGAHAYIINKKACNVLISKSLPIKKAYDVFYSETENLKDLKIIYIHESVCGVFDYSDTTTQNVR